MMKIMMVEVQSKSQIVTEIRGEYLADMYATGIRITHSSV
jgi:hypothetical protein